MKSRAQYLLILALGGSATALSAQSGLQLDGMAGLTVMASRADPKPNGGRVTELRVLAPMLIGEASTHDNHFHGLLTLNFEGATIRNGVLNPGAWGEGFVDRRHPHTTFHELLLSGTDLLGKRDGAGKLGVVLGKGFVPFGTDDPMNRPFITYPVNHHWSQILERAVTIVQYQVGKATIEGALFNGDEPERPSQWPLIVLPDGKWRFADSRSARVTFAPVQGLEMQGSLASVHSPEHRPGLARNAEKASVSARYRRATATGSRYAMLEWARTSELDGFFVFHSVLAEGSVQHHALTVSYRFESTERPEEERLFGDIYRSFRPHLENSILGIGKWTLHTLRVSADLLNTSGRTQIQPFLEATAGRVTKVGGGVFDPTFTYSGGGISQLNVGLTLGWGMREHRMGRYGVLASHEMAGMHGMMMP